MPFSPTVKPRPNLAFVASINEKPVVVPSKSVEPSTDADHVLVPKKMLTRPLLLLPPKTTAMSSMPSLLTSNPLRICGVLPPKELSANLLSA